MRLLVLFFTLYISLLANDNNSSFNSQFVPIVSSNPNSGTSAGILNTMIYDTDKNSSVSQAIVMAQYSNTDSWSLVGFNKSFFDSNKYRLLTLAAYVHNNSDLSIANEVSLPVISQDFQGSAKFEVDIFFSLAQLLYEVHEDIYLGGQVLYTSIEYKPTNNAGKYFMLINGMQSTDSAAYGITLSYDTRSLEEKIYPREAMWIDFIVNNYPTSLGNESTFTSAQVNARVYTKGFKSSDVWANQFFGQYSSQNTPDSSLAALGSRDVLRGFSIGQYKARYMSALQSEYRYELDGTRFRFVGFVGLASLDGGSKGKTIGGVNFSRKDDGIYSNIGVGVRYAIQKKAGVDYRLDVAHTNTGDYGLYATVNQAF